MTNLIVDGNFASSDGELRMPWWATSETVNTRVEEGRLKVEVAVQTPKPEDAIIGQNGLELTLGQRYRVSFRSNADTVVSMAVRVQQASKPWTSYFDVTAELLPSTRIFEYIFVALRSDSDASFQLQLGGLGAVKLEMDDVILESLGTASPDETQAFCRDYARFPKDDSAYENNVWGKNFVESGERYEQCLRGRVVAGIVQLGWAWQWPDRFEPRVYAYPEIVYGIKPWGGDATNQKLPRALQSITSATLSYEVKQSIQSGAYNLAPEIWITNTGTSIKKENVAAELMFWMDYNQSQPAGVKVDEVVIGGRRYDVFRKDDMGGPELPIWPYLAFRSQTPKVLAASLPIHEFIQYAIAIGVVNRTHYLASVELGNEISSGHGETWVRRFEVAIA